MELFITIAIAVFVIVVAVGYIFTDRDLAGMGEDISHQSQAKIIRKLGARFISDDNITSITPGMSNDAHYLVRVRVKSNKEYYQNIIPKKMYGREVRILLQDEIDKDTESFDEGLFYKIYGKDLVRYKGEVNS